MEHDERAACMIALDEGNRAMELALKAAPVWNIEQKIGVGRGLQLIDARQRSGQFSPERSNRRFGLIGHEQSGWFRRQPFCLPGEVRRAVPRPCFLLHGSPIRLSVSFSASSLTENGNQFSISCSKKTCRDSPRQDSPFSTPCHTLPNHGPIL